MNRILTICGLVNAEVFEQVSERMAEFCNEPALPVEVHINSRNGQFKYISGVIKELEGNPFSVCCLALEEVMGGPFLILQRGKVRKAKRISRLVLNFPPQEHLRTFQKYYEDIAKRSGRTMEELQELDGECLTSQRAFDLGLLDEIVD